MAGGVKIEGSSNCCLNFAWHYNSKYWIRILPLVFWPPYLWYFDHPYPWYIEPLPMVFWPPIYGILNPLLVVFQPPYPWYIDPPTHGISNPLLWYCEPLSFGRNEEGQFTMRGFKIQWRKIDPGVKIPYDTGNTVSWEIFMR